ncbi:MAG: glycosyltransferase family 39 protein [Candidatus Binatia bacterium]|nr:glycosyltransferase family 39 protein [Candidatus Binatia bacterium]
MKGASRTYVLGFFLLLGVAAGLRFWGLDSGLPHLMTRPDEEVLLLKTRFPASGQLDLQYNLRHPGVPSAYIFLLWGVGEVGLPVMQTLGYAPPGDYLHSLDRFPARLLLLERILSALAGIASVAALMWFTRLELGGPTALCAGAILATSFLHVRESHSAKPDVALGLFAILALGLLARMAREGTTRNAVKAGAAIGFGLAMKPPALLLFVPAWVAGMMSSTAAGWRRLVPVKSIIVVLVAVLIFVATSPDLFTNPETRHQLVNIVYIVFPEFTPEGEESPVAKTATTPARDVIGGYDYYYNFAYRHGAGWVIYVLTPMAVVWGFLSRTPLAILSSLFSVVGLVVFAGSTAWQARYLIPLLPGAAVLVAGMLQAGIRRLSPENCHGPLLAVATLVVIAQPLRTSASFDEIVARTDTRGQTTNWVRENLPPGSIVGVAGTVFWGWGEPWMPGNVKRVQVGLEPGALDQAGVEYLVTHDHPLFSSTIDPALLRRLEPRLELLTEFSPFVEDGEGASFDAQDAYYVPITGLDAVDRPGPVVKIYRVRADGGRR